MNPQGPAQPPSSPLVPPQAEVPTSPQVTPIPQASVSLPPIPAPPNTFPMEPQVQSVSAGKPPLGISPRGKIFVGIVTVLLMILAVSVVAFTLLGLSKKSLPIPNSPMAPAPSSLGTIKIAPAVTAADARDLRRIQDIEAIYTAIEMHYQALPGICPGSKVQVPGNYFCPPQADWFPPADTFPKDPDDLDYFGIPTQPVKSFVICAKLEEDHGNSSNITGASPSAQSANYYCKKN